MRARNWWLVGAFALSLAGCHSGPVTHVKDPGAATLAQGWQQVASPDKSVSIGIPPGWGKGMADQLSMTDLTGMAGGELSSGAMQEQYRQLDAEYEEEIQGAKARDDGLIVSVVDRQTRPIVGEQRTRFTVHFKEKSPGITLKEGADLAKDEIEGEGAPQNVTLPIGPAIRFDASSNQRDGSTLSRIMYVVVDGAKVYYVTFTTQGPMDTIARIAEPVAQTLRIKPSADR